MRKDLLRRHEERHAKGMWFRNSGGFVAANNNSSSPPLQPMRSIHLEHAAMFTEREQEEDVRMSSAEMPSVKISPYQETGLDAGVQDHRDHEVARLESAENPNNHLAYTQQMVPMEFHNPEAALHETDLNQMNYANAPYGEDQPTSLFLDPSSSLPDPGLDFEWLFDNLSAEMNSAGGSVGVSSVISPHSNISATDISPPALPVPSPASIRYPSSPQPMNNSPWVEVRNNLARALSTVDRGILESSFFYPNNLAGFWDLYFDNYHPHFPILHKHTLNPVKASPLMVAAIVTLGSTLSSDTYHWEVSTKIHDSLRYLIFGVSSFLFSFSSEGAKKKTD